MGLRYDDTLGAAAAFLTYVTTNATITYPGGTQTKVKKTADGYTDGGFYLTDPVTGAAGMYFEVEFRKVDSAAAIFSQILLKNASGIDYSPGTGISLQTNDLVGLLDGVGQGGITTVTFEQWYKLKLQINSDDDIEVYLDDVLEQTIADSGWIGNDVYWMTNIFYTTPAMEYRNFKLEDPNFSSGPYISLPGDENSTSDNHAFIVKPSGI